MSNHKSGQNKDSSKSILPRYNFQIKAPEIRLIDEEGNMLGVMKFKDALYIAQQRGKDIVEISPNVNPPVCKLLDFGKYKFELQKKQVEAKKKQKAHGIKEIQLRPNISSNDLDTKKKALVRFIEEGNKVRVIMKFRGRELIKMERGQEIIDNLYQEMQDMASLEVTPKIEGKQVMAIFAPKIDKKRSDA